MSLGVRVILSCDLSRAGIANRQSTPRRREEWRNCSCTWDVVDTVLQHAVLKNFKQRCPSLRNGDVVEEAARVGRVVEDAATFDSVDEEGIDHAGRRVCNGFQISAYSGVRGAARQVEETIHRVSYYLRKCPLSCIKSINDLCKII